MVTEKYKALVERFPLVPIRSDDHLDQAHEVAQLLMMREEPLSFDEREYLEVLLSEIGKYEKKHHDLVVQDLAPNVLLQSLMKDHGLKQVDIQAILGVNSSGVISEIVSGKRELTKEHCVKLGNHFKLTPAAFLPRLVV
ncbi:MAG: transcriptional regulator [Candidatus Obscuribacter sp.]|jgi:HTH-type transcriptional regulator/antitoxin HigA|nr:transcriptional regulator [Candidatus Obscuribacter sp.]MBK9772446.1 transcriptional regulator [Candidatus Obscuribacter sp.]